MSNEKEIRKLAAIMHADVKGYSRLMGEDESHTVRSLEKCRQIFTNTIGSHRGRVVNAPGDSILAEFPSVVSAVQCAVEIQDRLKERNADLPENRKMEYRIGVNLGDVIESGDAIYGDGVNIAARIEALTEPGGVSVSRTVFTHAHKQLDYGYEYRGAHRVKNIDEPVQIYRVLTAPEDAGKVFMRPRPRSLFSRGSYLAVTAALFILATIPLVYYFPPLPQREPAATEKMAHPLPDKPSIAVLPFVPIGPESGQNYIGDGLTADIIAALSKIPNLFVIAEHSALTFKGKAVNAKQVSEEMGVRYVLEGSVQTDQGKIRVIATLIDALKGKRLWTERYDRTLQDIFALQDEITINILTALQVNLTSGERIRVLLDSTKNLEAYQKYLKGREHWLRMNSEDNALARRFYEKANALDPGFTTAIVDLGWTHLMDVHYGVSESPKASVKKAASLAQEALRLDPDSSFVRNLLSFILVLQRKYEEAIAQGEKAVALSPGDSLAIAIFARTLMYAGEYDRAIPLFNKAIRLDPIPVNWYYTALGHCYLFSGQYQEALETLKKNTNRDDIQKLIRLATVYSVLDRQDDATEVVSEILRIHPSFSIGKNVRWPIKNEADMQFLKNALVKAGLPESPPLPLPEEPSIAVLPFTNMSGDPGKDYLSDGITEQIITSLSKIPHIFVISRTSTFFYKNKPTKIQQVAEELGVQYVLEGSIQKSGDKIRITAQLIDALTGRHVWSKRYERDYQDIFALQDEITLQVLSELHVTIASGERARLLYTTKPLNFAAFEKMLEAIPYIREFNPESNATARRLLQESMKLDPKYYASYEALAIVHVMDVWLGTSKSRSQSLDQAIELLQQAISLNENSAPSYSTLCLIYSTRRQYEKAIAAGQKAIEISPNSDRARVWLAMALRYMGKTEEAIQLHKQAIRLCPFPPSYYYLNLGNAFLTANRCEEAIEEYQKTLHLTPRNLFAFQGLSTCYGLLGQKEKSRAAAEKVMDINPHITIKSIRKGMPYKDSEMVEQWLDALRKAGIPEA